MLIVDELTVACDVQKAHSLLVRKRVNPDTINIYNLTGCISNKKFLQNPKCSII